MADQMDKVELQLQVDGTEDIASTGRALIQILSNISKEIIKTESEVNRLNKGMSRDISKLVKDIERNIKELRGAVLSSTSMENFNFSQITKDISKYNTQLEISKNAIKEINKQQSNNVKEQANAQKLRERNIAIEKEEARLRARQQVELNFLNKAKSQGYTDSLDKLAQEIKLKRDLLAFDIRSGKIQGGTTEYSKAKASIIKDEINLKTKQANAQIAYNKELERENDYNSIMSFHSAKRAIGYTALFAGIATVTGAVAKSAEALLEYDRMMYTFQAVLDVSADKAKKLEDNLVGLSIQYGEQLKNLNAVSLELGRAGVNYDQLEQATKRVTQLAILTGDSVESSTGAIVTFLQVFGSNEFGQAGASVEELSAKLAFLANSSKMNTQDINTFSNYALSTAKAVGMTIDQVNALAISLNNAGKNASTVGTNIRRFSEMLGDTNPKIGKFFNSIGINQATLQRQIAKGGEESNKAFIGFVQTLSEYSSDSINVILNGADTLMRDTILSIANSAPQILKNFQGSVAVTSNEIDKADLVAQTFERRMISLGNTITSAFVDMQPALATGASGLEWLLKNLDLVTYAVGAYLIATKSATAGVMIQNGVTATATTILGAYTNVEKIATASKIAFTSVTGGATIATKAFTATLLTNPLVIGAVAIAGGIYAVSSALGVFKEKTVELNSTLSESSQLKIKEIEANDKLTESAKQAMIAQVERADKANKLKEQEKKNLEETQKRALEYKKIQDEIVKLEGSLKSGNLAPNVTEAYSKTLEVLKNKEKEFASQFGQSIKRVPEKVLDTEWVKTLQDRLNIATDALNIDGLESKGKEMINQVQSILIKESKDIIPNMVANLNDPNINNMWQNLGALQGESYLTGLMQFTLGLNEVLTQIEVQIKSATGKAKDDLLTQKESIENLLKTVEPISKVGLQSIRKQNTDSGQKKSIYDTQKALKEEAIIRAELAQYAQGLYNSAEGNLEIAMLEVQYAKENLNLAIQRNEKEKDIAKFKRDVAETELKLIKAQNEVISKNIDKQFDTRSFDLQRQQFDLGIDDKAISKLQQAQVEYEKIIKQAEELKLNQDEAFKLELDRKKALLELDKARLEVEKERITLLTEDGIRAIDLQSAKLENMQTLLGSIGESEDKYIQSSLDISDIILGNKQTQLDYDRQILELNDKYAKEFLQYQNNPEELAKSQKKAIEDYGKANERQQAKEIAGYAEIAGAMSSMFEKGSKEAEAFKLAQTALVTVNAINAVLAQGNGDPYTAIPRMIAMGAMVASLISQIGVTLKTFGGSKESTSYDYVSGLKANDGTGSVLGDTTKTSESITNSLQILKDFAQPQFETLQSMNKYLENISNNINGLTSILFRNEGYALGEGYTDTSSGWKNNISLGDNLTKLILPIQSIIDKTIGKIPIIGNLTGMLNIGGIFNKVLGGLFGKTSVKQKLTDSGIYFADQLMENAIKDFQGSAYQTIKTTVSKKSWVSSSSKTTYKTYFEELQEETNRQFTLIMGSIYNTVLTAGEALDISTSELEKRLDSFVISIGKVSLKDKTGDEIQKLLTNVFGKVADDLTKYSIRGLEDFQQIGEGLFETLTRVATGMEEAEFYISRLGKSFSDLNYLQVENKQGNVGFEVLLQSIKQADEATYGLNNNLIKIISNLDTTAEELYQAYTTLDSMRQSLMFLGKTSEALSKSMIVGAGSVTDLQNGIKDYISNFLDENEQLAHSTNSVKNEFNKLGVALPSSKEGFKALINGLDLTTEAGQELYGRLIILSKSFAEVADGVEEYIKGLEEQLKDTLDTNLTDFSTTVSKMFGILQDNILKTQNLIDKLNADSDKDLTSNLIKYNQAYLEYMKTGSQESLDLFLKYAESSANLGGNTSKIVEELERVKSGLIDEQSVLKVDIVNGLGDLLGLNKEQVAQLQEVAKDGNITKEELNSIKGLTETQKNGILTFANNSGYFSTEETLSSLNEYMKKQLETIQKNQLAETEKLSKTTFTYGDYIGTQEKLDIAKTLGVTYESAKPLVEKLQALSVSKDPTSDIKKILGFTGKGDLDYDITTASYLEKLSPYLSDYKVEDIIASVKTETLSNQKEAERQKNIATATAKFQADYKTWESSLATIDAQISSFWANLSGGSRGKVFKQYFSGVTDYNKAIQIYNNMPQNDKAVLQDSNKDETYFTLLKQKMNTTNNPPILETYLKGFSQGGYTGEGGIFEEAGVVHKREYVVNAKTTRDLGLNNSAGVFIEMLNIMKETKDELESSKKELETIKQENTDMKNLMIKLVADNSKMLTLERATYSSKNQ